MNLPCCTSLLKSGLPISPSVAASDFNLGCSQEILHSGLQAAAAAAVARHMAARKAAFLPFLAVLCCALFSKPAAAWATAHRHSLGTPPDATHVAGMHIVIAMYQEDITEVKQYLQRLLSIPSVAATRPRIFIYVKGGPPFVAQAREAGIALAHDVVELPNIGREQESYLRHVIAHYDSLPQHVFFSQALPNYEDLVLGRLQTLFGPRSGVLGLGLVAVCTCEGHSQIWPEYGAGGFIRLREVLLAALLVPPHPPSDSHSMSFKSHRSKPAVMRLSLLTELRVPLEERGTSFDSGRPYAASDDKTSCLRGCLLKIEGPL